MNNREARGRNYAFEINSAKLHVAVFDPAALSAEGVDEKGQNGRKDE